MTAPYTGINVPQPGQSLQRLRRVWRVFTDQHGRRFGAQAEMSTNQPIGEFQPQGFMPPWLPPMRFAKWREVGDLEFRWDYQTYAEELGGMTAAYYQDAVKFAIENNKPEPEVGGPVDRSIRYVLGPPPLSPAIPLSCEVGDPWMLGVPNAPVNQELKAILEQQAGANGQDALNAIRARLQEHVDASAVPMVPTIERPEPKAEVVKTIHDIDESTPIPEYSYNAFVREARKRGKMSMADISLAWAAHKKNLADDEAAANKAVA